MDNAFPRMLILLAKAEIKVPFQLMLDNSISDIQQQVTASKACGENRARTTVRLYAALCGLMHPK